jgi:hypothetical protein
VEKPMENQLSTNLQLPNVIQGKGKKNLQQPVEFEPRPKRVKHQPELNDYDSPGKMFQAGNLKNHLPAWEEFTSDPNILQMVSGCKIEFKQTTCQFSRPQPYHFSRSLTEKISEQIDAMAQKGIIEMVENPESGFLSNIFTRNKSDGSLRIILDFTLLNEFVLK